MEPELDQQLQKISKEHLILLLQELTTRHPVLRTEIGSILDILLTSPNAIKDEGDEEVTEDWDFTGDELSIIHTFPSTTQAGPAGRITRVSPAEYRERLHQSDFSIIAETLPRLLEEAELCTEEQDFACTLDLYALLLDERLQTQNEASIPLFDDTIDEVLPMLEELLCEASSNAMFDATSALLSPLLTSSVRHRWLERLFALWLKRLDARRIEEDLPEVMLNMAWSDDILFLHSLAQNELQRHPRPEHSNIVDLTQQYRTRALEKFVRELPQS